MTVDGDSWTDVYYEDIRVLRVYPQDNQENGNTGDLAENRWPSPGMGENRRQQPVLPVAQVVPAAAIQQATKKKEPIMKNLDRIWTRKPILGLSPPKSPSSSMAWAMGDSADAILDHSLLLGSRWPGLCQ